MESSILGSLHSFNFFFVMGQSNWLIAKKKTQLDLWGTPNKLIWNKIKHLTLICYVSVIHID
jgi:hypothetical protein